MRLIFSPIRMDQPLEAEVDGDVLALNGDRLDFGPLPSGAILPRDAVDSPWLAGDVTRDAEGTLIVPLLLPHGPEAPPQTLFPQPIEIARGTVALPPYQIEDTRDED